MDFQNSRVRGGIGAFMRDFKAVRSTQKRVSTRLRGHFRRRHVTRHLVAVRDRCVSGTTLGWQLNDVIHLCVPETIRMTRRLVRTFVLENQCRENVIIDENGITSRARSAPADPSSIFLKFVYFARPDSDLMGKSVDEVPQFAARAAKEYPSKRMSSFQSRRRQIVLGYRLRAGTQIPLDRPHQKPLIQPERSHPPSSTSRTGLSETLTDSRGGTRQTSRRPSPIRWCAGHSMQIVK